ncbi:MAG: hypothetical protein AB7T14_03390 [Candidatus Methylacidiphilaceae bacterium]
MAGKPYRSKLEAHWDTIRELRQRRKSWREITEILRARGVTVSQHALYNFVQVRRKWVREGKFGELPKPDAIGKDRAGSQRPPVEAKTKAQEAPVTAAREEPQSAAKEGVLESAIAAAKAAARERAAHQTVSEVAERIEGLTFLT